MSRCLSWAVSTRLVTAMALALPSCRATAFWRLSGCEEQRLLQGWSTTRGMQHVGWRWSCSTAAPGFAGKAFGSQSQPEPGPGPAHSAAAAGQGPEINNMVPKKQFEQLQNTLREEQCKTQQLQESLQLQAEQTCRQLVRTQEEHEQLLQAAVEQAEGLEQSLRNAEALLAERAAELRDAQAQLSRNKLLIEELRGENRRFAMALQAAELKQKSMEKKNQLLEEQASALKQLIGKITPASLSG